MLGPLPTVTSQFEVGSSFAVVPDPVDEAAAFFAHFDQHDINDLDPQTSGVPALHMWTFMVSGFPRIAFLT